MFRQHHLRTTSGSSRPPSHRRAASASSAGSRAGTPAPPASGFSQTTGTTVVSAPFGTHAPSASDSSVDDSISLGVRRHRDDDMESSSTQLSPQRIKRLKTYARKVCKDLSIDEKLVFDFVDTGDLYFMLVDIKATLVKYEASNQTSQLQALQDILTSKDFEIGLSTRLLACILSPNITAYITDTQCHIMEFIANHLDVFKIPAAVFDDSELRSTLGRVVTKLLSDIRSRLKSHLTVSIVKKTCIIDVAKAMARASAGMEVDATHWTRLAFLRCCLRLFLIGTGDRRIAPLDACFTPRLIPMLKSDMRAKIEQDLGINLREKEQELNPFSDSPDATANDEMTPPVEDGDGSTPAENEPRADSDWSGGNGAHDQRGDTDADGIPDTDGNPDAQGPSDSTDELDETDSGFGLNGQPVRFNTSRFWNYVDYMLNVLRETARKTAPTKEMFEKEVQSYMMQIFQDDLADCPGVRRGSKLTSVVNPQWQSTIQQGLVW